MFDEEFKNNAPKPCADLADKAADPFVKGAFQA